MTISSISLNKLYRKISRLTDNNDHNESVLVLAKYLEDKEAIEAMESIQATHRRAGYMETAWIQERTAICKGLINKVLFLYGEEISKKINGAF